MTPTNVMQQPEILTMTEVAQHFRISVAQAHVLRRRGLKSFQVGRLVRVRRADMMEYEREQLERAAQLQ